jgi:hypothetical protein
VDEVHKLLGEFLKSAMLKVSHFEVEIAKLSKKLIGMRFNVGYLKSTTLKARDYVMHGECKLQVLDCEIDFLEKKICQFCVGCACINSCFLIFGIWSFGIWTFHLD